jgi:hypothetical protein
MRSYLTRPPDHCKAPSGGTAEIPALTAPTPGRSRPPDPAERARRVAWLRAALASSAPEFDALARRGGEGRP